MTGAWTLTDDGEWVLNPEYRHHLHEAKQRGMKAWCDAVYRYVSQYTGYKVSVLETELNRRCQDLEKSPLEIVDSFIIEAFEHQL